MENENKLDLLTKKIYQEGIEKANNDAQEILDKARKDAENILKDAENRAKDIVDKANDDAANVKQKTEAEMSMSVKQAVAALKQQIVNIMAGDISKNIAKEAFNDKDFVHQMMMEIIRKWNPEGKSELSLILGENEKKEFESYLAAKHKKMLDDKLTIKVNPDMKDGFVVVPQNGNYRLTFTEEMFDEFFNAYIKDYSKKLLFG